MLLIFISLLLFTADLYYLIRYSLVGVLNTLFYYISCHVSLQAFILN